MYTRFIEKLWTVIQIPTYTILKTKEINNPSRFTNVKYGRRNIRKHIRVHDF